MCNVCFLFISNPIPIKMQNKTEKNDVEVYEKMDETVDAEENKLQFNMPQSLKSLNWNSTNTRL